MLLEEVGDLGSRELDVGHVRASADAGEDDVDARQDQELLSRRDEALGVIMTTAGSVEAATTPVAGATQITLQLPRAANRAGTLRTGAGRKGRRIGVDVGHDLPKRTH